MRKSVRVLCLVWAVLPVASIASADQASIARGKYLVNLGHCSNCHTPGSFLGKPDFSKMLGGSDVGFEVPNLGVFYGPNLTPDKDTGLGLWSDDQIIAAITTGTTPDKRELADVMPWRELSQLTKADLRSIVDYLRSLPAVKNRVPGPFGPSQKPTGLVMKIVPPS